MRVDVVSIFPEYLAPLRLSLLGRAAGTGLLDVHVHDLRDFTHDRHRTVDDTPYGGGAGMVMRPEPWGEALDHVLGAGRAALGPDAVPHLLVPSPAGRVLTQAMAHELAEDPWLAFACGRYEGIDERVLEDAAARGRVTPVSLGDYVLNGGEVAVLAVVEAVGRLLPGVVGNPASLVEESHADGLLEHPVYTKPESWRGPGRARGAALGPPRPGGAVAPRRAAAAHRGPAPGPAGGARPGLAGRARPRRDPHRGRGFPRGVSLWQTGSSCCGRAPPLPQGASGANGRNGTNPDRQSRTALAGPRPARR